MLGRRLISAAILAFLLLAPASAWAGEDEDAPFAAFAVNGSSGYRIFVIAQAEADGRGPGGEVALLAMDARGARLALYQTKAVVTTTTLQADFGRLGRIDLFLARSGQKRRVAFGCGGRLPVEKANYWGAFEFHGEEGFTEASANRIAFNPYAFIGLVLCRNHVDVTASGPNSPGPGALLAAFAKLSGRSSLSLKAVKSRPSGRTLLRATLSEQRGGIRIARALEMKTGAGAFEYDRGLQTAVLDPPAPFSGSARFRRDAEDGGRWTGGLRVDLPGRANVALTRSELRPKLRRGSWQVSRFSDDRPTLGRPLALLEER